MDACIWQLLVSSCDFDKRRSIATSKPNAVTRGAFRRTCQALFWLAKLTSFSFVLSFWCGLFHISMLNGPSLCGRRMDSKALIMVILCSFFYAFIIGHLFQGSLSSYIESMSNKLEICELTSILVHRFGGMAV